MSDSEQLVSPELDETVSLEHEAEVAPQDKAPEPNVSRCE
jgi:hypothetical protein